jgi:hypothetical protein
VTISFRQLRDALTNLALPADQQRQALAGTVVTDELALDLDYAVTSLKHEMQRTGIDLNPELLAALVRFNDTLRRPPRTASGTRTHSIATRSGRQPARPPPRYSLNYRGPQSVPTWRHALARHPR